MEEIWKDVYYKGVYTNRKISNFGNLRMDTGLLVSMLDNGAGYLTYAVASWKDDEGKWRSKREYVHRMVAQYFIPNPDNLPQVNHIDCDKSNNHWSNLEWSSRRDNINHAHKMGRMKKRTEDTETEVLSVAQVIDLYTSVKRDKIGISEKARQMDIPRTTASSIMNKRSRETITNRIDKYLSSDLVIIDRMLTFSDLGFTEHSQLTNVRSKLSAHNTSGAIGVFRTDVEGVPYWMAQWRYGDKKKTKYFNVTKHGEEGAYQLACEHRESKLAEINGVD